MTKRFLLKRKRPNPGDVVMRFGDWRKREPHVMIDNKQWASWGKPETITVELHS